MGKYCEYPWTIKVVKLFEDSYKFCCKVESLPEAKHQIQLEEVKQDFLKDREHPACSACWNDESRGGKSFRLLQYPASKPQIIEFNLREQIGKSNLKIIDVEFGYTCNMSCITCGPGYSSTWQHLLKVYPWKTDIDVDQSLNKLKNLMEANKYSLEKINLFGGEPSVDPMYYAVADMFEKETLPKCAIRIITNGNYSENFKIKFEKSIKKFINDGRKIDITMSLDGSGENVEFIRGGLSVNRFINNVRAMIEFGIKPTIQISIGVLNLENYIEIFDYFEKENLLDKVDFRLNKISHPYDLSYNILGKHINDFLPKWPNEKWKKHKLQFDKFVGDQSLNTSEPDFKKLNDLLNRIDRYSSLSNRPCPDYYNKFKKRITNIIIQQNKI
jgi:MoaA/NifB/PqqE/SkfB family radical SAM enzyme